MLTNVRLLASRRCYVSVKDDFRNSRGVSSKAEVNPKPKWDKVVKDAEKIVGYGTSYANLRWLMNDEVANVAMHLKKLVGTNHPVLNIAKNFLLHEKNNIQTWGLVILLLSKAAGIKSTVMSDSNQQLEETGVLQTQRNLAEITELIKTGHLIHTGLLHILPSEMKSKDSELALTGNKIALLTGDFLLVKANGILANLRCPHVSGLVSSALRDLTEGEFIGERNPQNIAIPSKPVGEKVTLTFNISEDVKIGNLLGPDRVFKPLDTSYCIGNPIREWTMRNILGGGSLLGKGCESALHMAGHDQDHSAQGYLFGCHMALIWQATTDITTITYPTYSTFSLVSAPILFALHHDPSIYDLVKDGLKDVDLVDFDQVRAAVKEGPALENTIALLNEHSEAACKCLEHFPNSDAKKALRNIIDAMRI